MVYFLINNNYHLYDLECHIYQFYGSSQQLGLIQVPHTLTVVKDDHRFSKNLVYPYFFNGWRSLLKIKHINKLHKTISKDLVITANDTLCVYTELEVLNQYIIAQFKKAAAKVWLLEDGMATVSIGNTNQDKKMGWKVKLYEWILKYVYGYKALKIIGEDNNIFPVMKDEVFEGVCLYLGQKMNRKLKINQLLKNIEPLDDLQKDHIIFFNEDIYNFYCPYDQYIYILKDILYSLTKKFDKVYFKFHPREKLEMREKITNALKDMGKLSILETDAPSEAIVKTLKTKFSTAFLSNACMNLYFYGIQPIYLFHLFPQLLHNPVLKGLKHYLDSIHYNFVKDLDSIDQDYDAGIERLKNQRKLIDIISR